MFTPWGASQTNKEISPGIREVTTASHGGYCLDEQRLAELLAFFPNVKPYAGLPWFEEDCDWAYVALAFPGAFSDHMIEAAVSMSESGTYIQLPVSFLHTEHWHAIARRVSAFRLLIADKWRVGSMGSGKTARSWAVNLTHCGSGRSKWVDMPDYPRQTYWTDAEIEAIEAGRTLRSPAWTQPELITGLLA